MRDAKVFIDSNILLYSRDEAAGAKEDVANRWLSTLAAQSIGRTNLQVLNEVTHVLLRKRAGLSTEAIFEQIDALRFFGNSPVTEATVALGRSIRFATSYQWWDCLLLASALELGCTHFLSEDLPDGQRVEAGGKALTIVSPFAHTPDQILSL